MAQLYLCAMAAVHFKLRSSTVYLIIGIGNAQKYRRSTGIKLSNPQQWSASKERIKVDIANPLATTLNKKLTDLKRYMQDRCTELQTEGVFLTKEKLDVFYDRFENHVGHLGINKNLLSTYVEDYLNYIATTKRSKGRKLKPRTLTGIKTSLGFYNRFEQENGAVQLKDISTDLYVALLNFSEAKGYTQNYFGTHVKNLKPFFQYLIDQKGLNLRNYRAQDWEVLSEEVNEIYLTEEELEKIYRLDLSDQTDVVNRTRDLFMIGANTGLRVSDYNKLSDKHIINEDGRKIFKIVQQKTGHEVFIPVKPVVEEILEKYEGIPRSVPEHKMNKILKDLGDLAGLDDEVFVSKTVGGVKKETAYKKYELIKNHTGRRSFCTNAYLAGLDSLSIMAISGHTSEKNFLKYIKVTKKQQAIRMLSHPFFTKKMV